MVKFSFEKLRIRLKNWVGARWVRLHLVRIAVWQHFWRQRRLEVEAQLGQGGGSPQLQAIIRQGLTL